MKEDIKDIINKEVLTEKEVLLLKRRLNNKKITQKEIFNNDFSRSFKITKEQTEKGLRWLNSLRFTPKGKEKQNSPFGYREDKVLDNFNHFILQEFYNDINNIQSEMGINNFLPLWLVVAKDKSCFQYYTNYKGINITG